MNRPDYIASDVHLGAVPRATESAFVRFLEHAGSEAGSVLIAGDLFDFWFEYGPVIPGRHFRVLAAMADLVDSGVPVTLVGGNHDAWGGRFLRDEVGATFHADPFHTTLGGRRTLVAHGDGLGRGDWKYRALKAVIRSRLAVGAFRVLHPELGVRLAAAVSSTDARSGAADPGVEQRARFLEQWAADRLAEDAGLEQVVCGHAHIPAIRPHGPGRYYLNPGDWLTHFTYITVAAGHAPELRHWPAPGTDQAARP